MVNSGETMIIMNRNEAGNYLFGMAGQKRGIPLSIILFSGHGVEWLNRSALIDEPAEQQALKMGYHDSK